MPQSDPSKAAANPELQVKKVSWLELFFDTIFALALAMSAKSLEHVNDLSRSSWLALGEFILIFIFLITFWYRHMVLVNRFDYVSFSNSLMTLFIGFIVIGLTQFIRIWRIDAPLGSYLATISMALGVFSLAALYFYYSKKITIGGENEKKWAGFSAKHMALEASGYLAIWFVLALGWISPTVVPFMLIIVYIYFNRYPFETYFNPKKQTTLPPELVNIPPENKTHKTERIGLFCILVFGLVIVLAATPLFQMNSFSTVEDVLNPVIIFGKIFLLISILWYLYFRSFELAEPKGNQFTIMTFINLGLLVGIVHFMRIMFIKPSNFVAIIFAIFLALFMSVTATVFWNMKSLAGVSPSPNLLIAFKQWAYILYAVATAFFVSIIFQSPVRDIIWQVVLGILIIALIIERRLKKTYYMGKTFKKNVKFMDYQTITGITLVVIGFIVFIVITSLLGKPIASMWILTWAIPLVVGFFTILNHWLHTRIKPN
ncbi:hypothetical protein GF336_05845 [Candidatus Woesearchaeota archaeon]|nr:hypothetical protein [Candidatus Woesearchaeota archaeon]